jgi:hypothetical protein
MNETDKFIMEISTVLNESGSYKAIQESSISNLSIELDNDSEVWQRIEEAILHTIYKFYQEEEVNKPSEGLKGVRDSMIEGGAWCNHEGAVYLSEGVWIMPDGTLDID